MTEAHTDIPHSDDPQVRAVFEAMNAGPGYCPEAKCAEMVRWFRAWDAAKAMVDGDEGVTNA